MAVNALHSPFADPAPGYIPLASSPLVRTIAQIRFPVLSAFVADEDGVANRVAAALADTYPLIEVGHEVTVTLSASGANESQGQTRLWRLTDAAGTWQVSYGRNFLSLDTASYVRRRDFAERLTAAWDAFAAHVRPPFIERLGVRYLNQVADPALLARLPELVRPEVLGIAGAVDEEVTLHSALSEVLYQFPDDCSFQARWGRLPPGWGLDPALPPNPASTWVLDMDSFKSWVVGAYSAEDLYETTRALMLRSYQFFRWSVTDEFLRAHGGEPE